MSSVAAEPIANRGSPSVVLADHYPAIIDAVTSLMEANGIVVAGVATTAEATVEVTAELRPTVVITDLWLPTPTGVAILEALHRRAPESKVVVFTSVDDEHLAARLLEAGATGVVPKDASMAELLRAVTVVTRGGTYVDTALAASSALPTSKRDGRQLTRRELEILQLLADGGSNRTAAEELHIAPDTVRAHVRNAMSKLRSGTRTQAVAAAMRRALIS